MCHGCLESREQSSDSPFVHCPSCNAWTCRLDVKWCPERIIHPTPGSQELAEASRTYDTKSIVRAHSLRPGPCVSCIKSGRAGPWYACSGERSNLCPSLAHLSSELYLELAYCTECVAVEKGRRCGCGAVWLCDACLVVDYPRVPDFVSCCRCGTTYCMKGVECRRCYHPCQICNRTAICFGCLARVGEKRFFHREDMGAEPSDGFRQCQECRSHVCNECCSQCSGCRGWMCSRCALQRVQWHSCSKEGMCCDVSVTTTGR